MVVYLDNAATSWPKPEQVYRAMDDCIRYKGANPGRSAHKLSIEAARIIFNTRELLAQLFGIKNPAQLVFTANGTEALNLAIKGLSLAAGDHVIVTSMEHNSVMRPLWQLVYKHGIELTKVQCTPQGIVDTKRIEPLIKPNTKLIITLHASNVTGTLVPIEDISRVAHKHNILYLVDAAQTAGTYPIDVEKMQIDMLAFTGHKSLFGPQGTGGLYVKEGIELEPLKQGGTGSESESELHPDFFPDKYESGTPNTVGIAGLGAGVKFILDFGIEKILEHKQMLTKIFLEKLADIEEIEVYGPRDEKQQTSIISFNIKGKRCDEVGNMLDKNYDIMSRVGLHCAPSAHKTLGSFPDGTIRISFGFFNTEEEIDYTIDCLKKIIFNT